MITALIPARGGSVRIPKKNIADLDGAPLVSWSIGSAQAAVTVDNIVVSSDDDIILALARDLKVVAHRRKPEFATDDATDYDVILDYLSEFSYKGIDDPEYIVYLRPTTPLRRSAWIDDAVSQFRVRKSATGLRSVHIMEESAFKCFLLVGGSKLMNLDMDPNVDLANFPNHHYAQTYKPNGAVDIVRPSAIRRGEVYGNNCFGYLTPWTVEIDTPTDLEYARFLAQRRGNARLSIEMA